MERATTSPRRYSSGRAMASWTPCPILCSLSFLPSFHFHFAEIIMYILQPSPRLRWWSISVQSIHPKPIVSEQLIFTVWSCEPHAQPPTWRTRVSLFVLLLPLDLPGMDEETTNTFLKKLFLLTKEEINWINVIIKINLFIEVLSRWTANYRKSLEGKKYEKTWERVRKEHDIKHYMT
jgi:hypothetical protein